MGQAARKLAQETGTTNGVNRKFGMRDKIGYMFGDFGNDFFFILVCFILNGLLYRCFSY